MVSGLPTASALGSALSPSRWMTGATPATAMSHWAERRALALLQRPFAAVPVRFVLWDGTAAGAAPASATATLTIRNRRVLLGLLLDPEMAFGDSYMAGTLEVQGDLVGLLEIVYRLFPRSLPIHGEWWQKNTRLQARHHPYRHYDLGNEFYEQWLDSDLVHTCAYFPDATWSLERAQRAKLDYVSRKLRLRPGERVIEAGCGWGALAMHMAAHYGVGVKAYAVSHEQVAVARERARRAGLSNRVEFIEADFRDIQGRCDAFVSLGMIERVGTRQFAELGAAIDRTLDPAHGRGLLQFIGRNHAQELSAWMRRRILPGAYAPTLAEVADAVFEPHDFSIVDVENLRLHYARTAEHWLERFDAAAERITPAYGDQVRRAWRLYLAGSIATFRVGCVQLFQVLFARGGCNDLSHTRAYLYDAAGGASS